MPYQPARAARNQRSYSKCKECRNARTKCLPVDRDFLPDQTPCDRCATLGLVCGPNTILPRGRHKKRNVKPMLGSFLNPSHSTQDSFLPPETGGTKRMLQEDSSSTSTDTSVPSTPGHPKRVQVGHPSTPVTRGRSYSFPVESLSQTTSSDIYSLPRSQADAHNNDMNFSAPSLSPHLRRPPQIEETARESGNIGASFESRLRADDPLSVHINHLRSYVTPYRMFRNRLRQVQLQRAVTVPEPRTTEIFFLFNTMVEMLAQEICRYMRRAFRQLHLMKSDGRFGNSCCGLSLFVLRDTISELDQIEFKYPRMMQDLPITQGSHQKLHQYFNDYIESTGFEALFMPTAVTFSPRVFIEPVDQESLIKRSQIYTSTAEGVQRSCQGLLHHLFRADIRETTEIRRTACFPSWLFAFIADDYEAVRWMISTSGDNKIAIDIMGRSYVHYIAEISDTSLLITLCTDQEALEEECRRADRLGMTPIQVAALWGNVDFLSQMALHVSRETMLLKNQFSRRDAFQYACMNGQDAVIQFYLQDLHYMSEGYPGLNSSIHDAAAKGHFSSVKLLFAKGFQPHTLFEEKMASEHAEQAGHEHIAAFLRPHEQRLLEQTTLDASFWLPSVQM